jgi:hypothetical protein
MPKTTYGGIVMICPYCNKPAELKDSSVIYGKSYGLIYICFPCNAYVGTHRGTSTPLGTLANSELRKLRKQCHSIFDLIWKSGKMSRFEAYVWLSKQLKIDINQCHIGMFDVDQCKKVMEVLQ